MEKLHVHVLKTDTFTTNLKLAQISNLCELVIQITNTHRTIKHDNIIAPFAHLISHSPRLTCLAIQLVQGGSIPFHAFLPQGERLGLTHLSLDGCTILLSDVVLLHLRSLTSLHLTSCLVRQQHDNDTGQALHTTSTSGENINIWSLLSQSGVCLTNLLVDNVDDDLMNYLASYSFLEHLSIENLEPPPPDAVATRFYQHILPRHSETLRTLRVLPRRGGVWCPNATNAPGILKCRKLSALALSIDSLSSEPLKPPAAIVSAFVSLTHP